MHEPLPAFNTLSIIFTSYLHRYIYIYIYTLCGNTSQFYIPINTYRLYQDAQQK